VAADARPAPVEPCAQPEMLPEPPSAPLAMAEQSGQRVTAERSARPAMAKSMAGLCAQPVKRAPPSAPQAKPAQSPPACRCRCP